MRFLPDPHFLLGGERRSNMRKEEPQGGAEVCIRRDFEKELDIYSAECILSHFREFS